MVTTSNSFTLVIGNKNYSSWSLRAWLALRHFNVPFDEVLIELDCPDTAVRIGSYSPAGRVPVLVDRHAKRFAIWDTLAIIETVAELYPSIPVWPRDGKARARARSICAEMHSGFAALRKAMPMNCRAKLPGCGINAESVHDITRIVQIWESCRAEFGQAGPFLFGAFSAADAFYAPVASRFMTYQPELPPRAHAWIAAIHALPAMQEWLAAAHDEPWTIAADEPYAIRPRRG